MLVILNDNAIIWCGALETAICCWQRREKSEQIT
jgi:hypothetical protein